MQMKTRSNGGMCQKHPCLAGYGSAGTAQRTAATSLYMEQVRRAHTIAHARGRPRSMREPYPLPVIRRTVIIHTNHASICCCRRGSVHNSWRGVPVKVRQLWCGFWPRRIDAQTLPHASPTCGQAPPCWHSRCRGARTHIRGNVTRYGHCCHVRATVSVGCPAAVGHASVCMWRGAHVRVQQRSECTRRSVLS